MAQARNIPLRNGIARLFEQLFAGLGLSIQSAGLLFGMAVYGTKGFYRRARARAPYYVMAIRRSLFVWLAMIPVFILLAILGFSFMATIAAVIGMAVMVVAGIYGLPLALFFNLASGEDVISENSLGKRYIHMVGMTLFVESLATLYVFFMAGSMSIAPAYVFSGIAVLTGSLLWSKFNPRPYMAVALVVFLVVHFILMMPKTSAVIAEKAGRFDAVISEPLRKISAEDLTSIFSSRNASAKERNVYKKKKQSSVIYCDGCEVMQPGETRDVTFGPLGVMLVSGRINFRANQPMLWNGVRAYDHLVSVAQYQKNNFGKFPCFISNGNFPISYTFKAETQFVYRPMTPQDDECK